GEQLAGRAERAVDDGTLLAAEADPLAPGARLEPVAVAHDSGVDQLLVVAGHLRDELLARHLARLGRLRRLDQDHDLHVVPSVDGWLANASTTAFSLENPELLQEGQAACRDGRLVSVVGRRSLPKLIGRAGENSSRWLRCGRDWTNAIAFRELPALFPL